ncbi:RNA recognition motif domain-containing protein [Mucilaginibacter terrae]|uniref:RNA recognition motif domain-containing protein n=1 Tax=Mucilaginibacter terrae TaxID=1955052 RepID=UPI0036258A07
MYKLFVSGFPLEITEIDLAKLIGPHGNIATMKIVRDKKTRICKGYAFVEMETLTDAENTVIALDGVMMGERALTVKINEEKLTETKTAFSRKPSNNTGGYKRPEERIAQERDKRPRRPRV